ncbi:MAG: MBOAT family protein [Bacteroidaceae bacterium]|nr:MBOAT family protein [Bacteroidaceae bacterium]
MLDNILQLLTYNPQEPILFSTSLFLYLFVAFVALYDLLQKRTAARLLFVTAFSYYFYYKSSGIYFFLLAVVTLSDYLLAGCIYRSHQNKPDQRRLRSLLLTLSLLIDLGLLAYFKYTNFFASLIVPLFGGQFEPMDIFLPVGISFFTFQSLSYTIDIYRGKLQPVQSLLDYAFFVSFFPQLVAGPIVRASDFVPQIRKPLQATDEMRARGIYFILCGLLKKCIISDYISLNFVDRIFDDPTLYSGIENLLGLYGYTLQIYCDFSGYSDMAIGIALLLGFHFPKNFDTPYISTNVSEFWHRWHISFSTWIRDYIYISLGGNRCREWRIHFNLFVTMLIGGLWHGASLNFVAWGAMHGAALSLHKWFRQHVMHHDRNYKPHGLRRLGATLLTFHFIVFTFIFFRSRSFETSWQVIEQIVFNFHPELTWEVITGYAAVMSLIALGYLSHFTPAKWQEGSVKLLQKGGILLQALAMIAAIYAVAQFKTSAIQPFIYFQF